MASTDEAITAAATPKPRLSNWDLLRSLAMFLVVVFHMAGRLGPIAGHETGGAVGEFALVCDPVFFTLSGYFALRPLKGSLRDYYLHKIGTILIPCLVYSSIPSCSTPGRPGWMA